MDVLLGPEVREVVFRKSTQVGYSEILNNIMGYYIDAEPKPVMIVQPTDKTAKAYSKKRIAPMIAACPALRAKVREAVSRAGGNTMDLKEYDGGFLKVAGANSGPGLRSDPIPIILFDEIDGYPDDVGGEGDPIDIGKRRADTFDDSKIFLGGTPAKPKGISRIESDYERSSQGRYFVPCPHCGFMQPLEWRETDVNGEPIENSFRLIWDKNENGDPIPGSVRYLCLGCKTGIEEKHKQKMLDAGEWRHRFPERRTVRGFYVNALYSPWKLIWDEMAQEWVDAQENPEKLKAFVNLRLGETWNEGGDHFGAHTLATRREKYTAQVPKECAVLIAAADVQHNRIEAQVLGFGAGEETWLIGHEVFWGNPGAQINREELDVWEQLEKFLLRTWQHECGQILSPAITFIDSGSGGHADSVYDFVLPRQNTRRRIFASKGVDYLSKPGLVAEGSTKRSNVRLFTVGTYAAKDRVFARMKIQKPGPGYMHLPDWVTDEYLEQLTGEKKISVRDKRTRVKKYLYVKTYHHNEALDLTVYCHAGLAALQHILAPAYYRDLAKIAELIQQGKSLADMVPARARGVRSPGTT